MFGPIWGQLQHWKRSVVLCVPDFYVEPQGVRVLERSLYHVKAFRCRLSNEFLTIWRTHTGCVKRQFICILYFCCAATKCENRNIFHVVKLGLWGHANLWWWHNTLLKLEKVFYRLKMGWHIWWTLWTKMHFCEESTPKGKRCKHCRINYITNAALWCTHYGGIFRFCKG